MAALICAAVACSRWERSAGVAASTIPGRASRLMPPTATTACAKSSSSARVGAEPLCVAAAAVAWGGACGCTGTGVPASAGAASAIAEASAVAIHVQDARSFFVMEDNHTTAAPEASKTVQRLRLMRGAYRFNPGSGLLRKVAYCRDGKSGVTSRPRAPDVSRVCAARCGGACPDGERFPRRCRHIP